MITGKHFASFNDSLPKRATNPIPEGAYVVRESRINAKATRWQRFLGDDMQHRFVPLRMGADGYLYGDFDAATEWK